MKKQSKVSVLLPFSEVTKGLTGIDYENYKGTVIAKGTWKSLKKHDNGAMADCIESGVVEVNTPMVAVQFERDEETEIYVYTYGYDGFRCEYDVEVEVESEPAKKAAAAKAESKSEPKSDSRLDESGFPMRWVEDCFKAYSSPWNYWQALNNFRHVDKEAFYEAWDEQVGNGGAKSTEITLKQLAKFLRKIYFKAEERAKPLAAEFKPKPDGPKTVHSKSEKAVATTDRPAAKPEPKKEAPKQAVAAEKPKAYRPSLKGVENPVKFFTPEVIDRFGSEDAAIEYLERRLDKEEITSRQFKTISEKVYKQYLEQREFAAIEQIEAVLRKENFELIFEDQSYWLKQRIAKHKDGKQRFTDRWLQVFYHEYAEGKEIEETFHVMDADYDQAFFRGHSAKELAAYLKGQTVLARKPVTQA